MGRVATYRIKVILKREEDKSITLTRVEDQELEEVKSEEAAWESGDDIMVLAKNLGEYNSEEITKTKGMMFESETLVETTIYEKRLV